MDASFYCPVYRQSVAITGLFDLEGYDTYIVRDLTGTYWYIIDTEDYSGPEGPLFAEPCRFGPDPA